MASFFLPSPLRLWFEEEKDKEEEEEGSGDLDRERVFDPRRLERDLVKAADGTDDDDADEVDAEASDLGRGPPVDPITVCRHMGGDWINRFSCCSCCCCG